MLVHALAVPGDASDSSSVTIINTKRNELDTGIDKTWAIINEARITLIVVLGLSMAVHTGIHKEEKLESMFNSSSDTSYIFFIGATLDPVDREIITTGFIFPQYSDIDVFVKRDVLTALTTMHMV